MIWTKLCLRLLACLSVTVTVSDPCSIPLRYYHIDMPAFNPRQMGFVRLEVSSEKPSLDCLPKGDSDYFIFFQWRTPRVESGYLWMALGRERGLKSYDRFIVDSDSDGSLHDETPIERFNKQEKSNRHYSFFNPTEIQFPGHERSNHYHLCAASVAAQDRTVLILSPIGSFVGTQSVDGIQHSFTLRDFTVNGVYNDRSDKLFISIRGYQREDIRSDEHIQIGPAYYTLNIHPDGASLELIPDQDIIVGSIHTDQSVTELCISGPQGHFKQKPDKGIAQFPEGTYRVQSYTIECTDSDNTFWQINGENFPRQKTIEVKGHSLTELKLGEPIKTFLHVDREDPNYVFRTKLKGPQGEDITLRDQYQQVKLKLHIRNAAGTYNQAYDFEYG